MGIDLQTIKPTRDNRSDLIKGQEKTDRGKVNACPFDADFRHLDENGYCRHLIGTTEDKREYEPMIRNPKTGARMTKCRTQPTEEVVSWDDGEGNVVKETVHKPVREKVKAGDVLVRISTSYRVYRNVDDKAMKPRLKVETKDQEPKLVQEMTEQVMAEQGIIVEKTGVRTLGEPEDTFLVAN